jgi:hypothetical protein
MLDAPRSTTTRRPSIPDSLSIVRAGSVSGPHVAIENGSRDVDIIIKKAGPTLTNEAGETLLHSAAFVANETAVQVLPLYLFGSFAFSALFHPKFQTKYFLKKFINHIFFFSAIINISCCLTCR